MIKLEILLHGIIVPVAEELAQATYSLDELYANLLSMTSTKNSASVQDELLGSGAYISASLYFTDEESSLFDDTITEIGKCFARDKVDITKRHRVRYHSPCGHPDRSELCAPWIVLYKGGAE